MIYPDPYAEHILYACDHCRRIGELGTDIREEDEIYYCWHCLRDMKRKKGGRTDRREKHYAFK